MKSSRLWTIGVIAFVIVGGAILIANRTSQTSGPPQLKVMASFYPLAEFTRQIGGNRVEVTTLVKPGVEPHDYDPTARDVAGLYKSAAFVYNGGGLEPWVGKLQKDLEAAKVMMIDASTGITLRTQTPDDETGATTDPHIWMDPKLAIQEVTTISRGLMAVDPEHASEYLERALAYTQKLRGLDEAFQKGLATCRSREIITSHQSLNYLAARYNLEAIGIAGLSPEDEPSPQKLAEIADLARQKGATHIFFESGANSKLSETIANEVGVRTLGINTLESVNAADTKAGKNYISIQQENLRNLQTGLGCT